MKKLLTTIQENRFLAFFIVHYKASEMDLSSIAVAYYLMLTMFPFLVLLANIFPYLNIDTAELLLFLRNNFPKELYTPLSGLIRGIFNTPSSGLVWVSVLTGLWTTSKGLIFLQKAVNKAYDIQEHRDAIIVRVVGGMISLILIFVMALGIILSAFGRVVLNFLYQHWSFEQGLYDLLTDVLQYATLGIFVIALGLLYFILPNVRVRRIWNVWPGTAFVSLVLLTSTNLFGTYLDTTMKRLEDIRFLGSMTVLLLMFWFIFLAKVLIMGAIINSTYQRYREGDLETRRGTVGDLLRRKKD